MQNRKKAIWGYISSRCAVLLVSAIDGFCRRIGGVAGADRMIPAKREGVSARSSRDRI